MASNDITENRVNMSKIAYDFAKEVGFGDDENKFKTWEKNFIKKFYEVLGLADIPDEFLNWTKFLESFSGILVKSVQNDVALLNLTKRLSMYKLSESINATADKPAAVPEEEAAVALSNNPPDGSAAQ